MDMRSYCDSAHREKDRVQTLRQEKLYRSFSEWRAKVTTNGASITKLVMLKVRNRRGKFMRTKKVVQATITASSGRVQRG